jgi:hypothetical protein
MGVFNPKIGSDSKLFVDTKLIDTAGEEFEKSTAQLTKYFGQIVTLLKLSKKKKDMPWTAAWKRMQFKETSNTAIGFSKSGTDGNGIGPVLAEKILLRAQEILPHVDFDPDIFELIGVFSEGIGCDRLSDMLVSILLPQFLSYTDRVTRELGVQRIDHVVYERKKYACPRFSKADKALILLPREALRPLPVALDIEDALTSANLNDQARRELNTLFSAAAKSGRQPSKSELREFIRSRPKVVREILQGYKVGTSNPYDFDSDPENVSDFDAIATEVVGEAKIDVAKLTERQRVDAAIAETLSHLKQSIQFNRLSDCLYDDSGKPRKELISQRILYAVAAIFSRLYKVSISREPNAGAGAVDFHFSVGHENRILLELKLSTHPRLVDAYREQLPAYGEAEGVNRLLLVVMRVSEDETFLSKLKQAMIDHRNRQIDVIIIDAVRKPTASKRRSQS